MRERIPEALRVEVAEMVGSTWWAKVLLATEHDRLGLILRAAMGLPTNNPPWVGPSAIIDQNGMILSNYVDENHKRTFAAAICHINDLVSNLRRLCDSLQLSDVHAHALFSQVKAWIKEDARPETEQPEDRLPIEYRRIQ